MNRTIPFFFFLFVLEIIVMCAVGAYIGVFNTITLIFVMMFVGVVLIRLRLRQISESLKNGFISFNPEILWLPFAGFLFFFPGFITDLFAIFILLSPVRKTVIDFILRKAGVKFGINSNLFSQGQFRNTDFSEGFSQEAPRQRPFDNGKVVDAEYQEIGESEEASDKAESDSDKKDPDEK